MEKYFNGFSFIFDRQTFFINAIVICYKLFISVIQVLKYQYENGGGGWRMSPWKCITPFVKQCIVTTGASVNMAASTFLMAYTSGLALQLRRPDSMIPIDTSIESWIAAVPSISALLGSFLMAIGMACLGRWISQIASIVILIIGWSTIIFANNVAVILTGRFFQGLGMGASVLLTPILIGEYTTPRLRGAFIMFTGVLSALYVLLSHTTALYLNWRTNAIIGAAIAVINLPIAIYSPESPSWLAARQRYNDCRRAFRWLRGDDEGEELENMIKASEILDKLKKDKLKSEPEMTIRTKFREYVNVILKKEFYKPILVTMHVYIIGQSAGSNLFNNYMFDLLENIVGAGYNEHATGININRVIGGVLSIYIIKKTKRRTLFLGFSSLNAIMMLVTAAYTYAKSKEVLAFDSPIIGLTLMHLLMFFISTCTLPVPYIIAGEIFPLKYKSIASGFTLLLVFIFSGIFVKTFPYILSVIGIHGAFTIYACIIAYSLVISYLYLPETKDRTLQDIGEEMMGKPLTVEELKSVQSLLNKPNSERD